MRCPSSTDVARPLHPEACATERRRPATYTTAGGAFVVDRGARHRLERSAAWTRDARVDPNGWDSVSCLLTLLAASNPASNAVIVSLGTAPGDQQVRPGQVARVRSGEDGVLVWPG